MPVIGGERVSYTLSLDSSLLSAAASRERKSPLLNLYTRAAAIFRYSIILIIIKRSAFNRSFKVYCSMQVSSAAVILLWYTYDIATYEKYRNSVDTYIQVQRSLRCKPIIPTNSYTLSNEVALSV